MSDATVPRRLAWRIGALLLALAGTYAVGTLDVDTRFGVDDHVKTRTIPLYLKGFEFVSRHARYRQLAREVGQGRSDEERMLRTLGWTRQHVRTPPAGFPIVDDHILNIITRGYGTSDQMADVFATLCTYAGIPAFWGFLRPPGTDAKLAVSFAQVRGRWAVIDVANNRVFRTSAGELASVEQIAADAEIVAAATVDLAPLGIPYRSYFSGFKPPTIPRDLRAELQMPWPRLWYELRGGESASLTLP